MPTYISMATKQLRTGGMVAPGQGPWVRIPSEVPSFSSSCVLPFHRMLCQHPSSPLKHNARLANTPQPDSMLTPPGPDHSCRPPPPSCECHCPGTCPARTAGLTALPVCRMCVDRALKCEAHTTTSSSVAFTPAVRARCSPSLDRTLHQCAVLPGWAAVSHWARWPSAKLDQLDPVGWSACRTMLATKPAGASCACHVKIPRLGHPGRQACAPPTRLRRACCAHCTDQDRASGSTGERHGSWHQATRLPLQPGAAATAVRPLQLP